MTDPPAASRPLPGPRPRRTPMDRLRGLDGSAPGSSAAHRSASGSHGSGPSPEPPPPPPAVIAVGDRPVAADGSGGSGTVPPETAVGGAAAPKRTQGSFLRELPVLLAIAIVLALLIKTFLVQAFFIPSGSMEQTLHIHDRVLVNKLSQHTGSPQRGDIVVFDTSGTGFGEDPSETTVCPNSNAVVDGIRAAQRFIGVGTCGQDDYIKRIIAVPGDTIQCCSQGKVLLDGKPLDESYVFQASAESPFCRPTDEGPAGGFYMPLVGPTACGTGAKPITVPAGMYWVMGDHRDDSADSRYHGFVPRDKIVGRAFVRIWPPSRVGFLRVPSTFQHVGATATAIAASPVLAAPAFAVPLVGGRLLRRRRRRTTG